MTKFEFISSIDNITPLRIWLVFGISFLYLLFTIRKSKLSFLSIILILLSFKGVFEYTHLEKYLDIGLFSILTIYVLSDLRNYGLTRIFAYYAMLLIAFVLTFTFHNSMGLLGYFGQFILLSFPFLFYIILHKNKHRTNYEQELDICIKLLNVQIVASILKLVLIGFNEKIAGTMSISGGSIPTLFPALYFVLIYITNKGEMKRKHWIMILLSFIVAIASNKRGVWFIAPLIIAIAFFLYGKIRFSYKSVLLIAIIPIIFYFGVRLNPTLNPDGVLWGSFDYNYVKEYGLAYNLGTLGQDNITDFNNEQATGRMGTNLFYLEKILTNPFSTEMLFGVGNETYNETEALSGDLGFQSKYMLTAWVEILVRFGLIVLVIFTISIIKMVRTIKMYKQEYFLILSLYFVYFIFYTSAIVKTSFLVGVICLLIFFVRCQLYENVGFRSIK